MLKSFYTKTHTKRFARFFSWKTVDVPLNKISFSYCRASGAGGQNVNKVSTKVECRFRVSSADWIEEEVKERLRELYPNKINSNDEFILTAQEKRTQDDNKKEAQNKLKQIIWMASQKRPQREFKPIAETEQQEKKRIQSKRKKSEVKKMRKSTNDFR